MDPIAPLIQNFHAEGRPRVWSLVITIFGDAVKHRGGHISGVRLQTLLERIGIESGAMRTALSRLAHDGWITRERQGRNSCYQLSQLGHQEFASATQLIYGAPQTKPVDRWTLASGETAPPNSIKIAPHLWLVAEDVGAGYLSVSGELGVIPENFFSRILPDDHRRALDMLSQDIKSVSNSDLEPLDAMAARTLLIHRWRRIVLRFSILPNELMPPEFRDPPPHDEMAAAYKRLAPMAEKWLDLRAGKLTPMPAASKDFDARFRDKT